METTSVDGRDARRHPGPDACRARWRPTLPGVLAERDVRLFVTGHLASMTGSAMVPVVFAFTVLGTGGSTADVGWVLAAEAVPFVALLLVGGVIADRLPRRTVMIGTDLVAGGSQLGLAVALFAGRPPLWALMAAAALLGGCQAFFLPALMGLIPTLAGPARLQDTNAVIGIARAASEVAGPALGGLIVAAGGGAWAVLADGLTFGVSALCLARLPLRVLPAADGRTSFGAQLRDGWQEFRSRTWLWVIVAEFGLLGLLVDAPFFVLGPVVADERLGGASAWGVVLAAFGAGTGIGGLVAVRLRPSRPLLVGTVGTLGWALPLGLLAAGGGTAAVAAGALVAGIGLALFGALWDTTLQREVPPEVLSRVSAYDWFGSQALNPVGFALAGPLAIALGTSGALWLATGVLVVLSLAVLAVRDVRRPFGVPVPVPEQDEVREPIAV